MLKLVILHWMLTSQASNSCSGVQSYLKAFSQKKKELSKGLSCKWSGGRNRVIWFASLFLVNIGYGVVIAMLACGVFPFLTGL
jgi:hypothetical protein